MKDKFRNYSHPIQVILGSQTIKAFVAAPREFKVVGIVRMGMEFGLLATTASGNYVRVNGSQIEPLSNAIIEEAIVVSRLQGRGESFATSRSHASPALPTIVVRKRRHVEPGLVCYPLTRAVEVNQSLS